MSTLVESVTLAGTVNVSPHAYTALPPAIDERRGERLVRRFPRTLAGRVAADAARDEDAAGVGHRGVTGSGRSPWACRRPCRRAAGPPR